MLKAKNDYRLRVKHIYFLYSVICEDLDYEKCKPYHHSNHTGFPNVFGSSNQNSAAPLMTDFEKFALTRCHPHTLLFACHAVFPDCVEGILKFPCRSFCECKID